MSQKTIVDIYRCKNKEGAYVYMAKGAKIDSLPEQLQELTGRLEHAMSLLLTPERKLANAEATKVLDAIDEKGFYFQMPPVEERDLSTIRNDKLPRQGL